VKGSCTWDMPTSWVFQGSNDGTSWQDLDTVEGQVWDPAEKKSFDVSACNADSIDECVLAGYRVTEQWDCGGHDLESYPVDWYVFNFIRIRFYALNAKTFDWLELTVCLRGWTGLDKIHSRVSTQIIVHYTRCICHNAHHASTGVIPHFEVLCRFHHSNSGCVAGVGAGEWSESSA
jgi:hypothetical protein